MPDFQLRKWYADLLEPATGQLHICYVSELRWGRLALRFTNRLRFPAPAAGQPAPKPDTTASFAQAATAELSDAGRVFTLRQRGLHGVWQGQGQVPAVREVLLETARGSVLWECFLPAATARLTLGAATHAGLGYVERLTLTLPPWQLPLQTLRWGRLVLPGHALVWVRWDGPAPRHLLFHNGRRYADEGHIGDDTLRFGPYEVTFTDKQPLRAGPVGRTVFSRFGWFRRLFPARVFDLDEVKWRSWATLRTLGGAVVTSGYAVHERVEWPL